MADSSTLELNRRSWNFFRRAEEPDLWCAVPVDRSLPGFLLSGAWRFGGDHPNPPGFRPLAALEADTLSGFYLFQHLP